MNLIRCENGTLLNPANILFVERKTTSAGDGRVSATAVMGDGTVRVLMYSNVTQAELEDRLRAADLTILPE